MIKTKQIAHVCIFAHDLDETRRFYEDVLGLDTQFNFLRDGKIWIHFAGMTQYPDGSID